MISFLYSRFCVNRRAFSAIKGKFVVLQLHLTLAPRPRRRASTKSQNSAAATTITACERASASGADWRTEDGRRARRRPTAWAGGGRSGGLAKRGGLPASRDRAEAAARERGRGRTETARRLEEEACLPPPYTSHYVTLPGCSLLVPSFASSAA